METPKGINEWVELCLSTINEVCDFKPTTEDDPSPSQMLRETFELMYKSAREFGKKSGFADGVEYSVKFTQNPALYKIYKTIVFYTDDDNNVVVDKNDNPIPINFDEDLKH